MHARRQQTEIQSIQVSNKLLFVISDEAKRIIAEEKTAYKSATAAYKAGKGPLPTTGYNTVLVMAAPIQTTDQSTAKVALGVALRDILPLNKRLKTLLNQENMQSKITVDKIEFSNEGSELLPPVLSFRLDQMNKKTQEKSEKMFRCEISNDQIKTKEIKDPEQYKENHYGSRNKLNPLMKHIKTKSDQKPLTEKAPPKLK